MSKKLAVLILTYNEEKNIQACLDSVSFADESVIIDSGSSDATQSIASNLGAKVVVRPLNGFAAQRNFALQQTDADWVLFLDADERITPELALEIQDVIKRDEPLAYEILRHNIVFGQPVLHGGHAPDWSLRLYPRTAIQWEGLVHEKACVSLPVKKLRQPMLHHTYTSWDRYFFKFNQYTTMMAKRMHQQGKRFRWFDLLLRPPFAFFRFYVLQRGWLDGWMGLVLALLQGFYTMVKYIKLYFVEKGSLME